MRDEELESFSKDVAWFEVRWMMPRWWGRVAGTLDQAG